jgi:hypothetical protein
MPIGVIAAGVGAAGAIGGAVLSSSAQKKAASSANKSQQQATQAQLQLGRESMALNRDIYNSNFGILSPFVSRGNVAGDSINALLGLPSAPTISSPLAGGGTTASPTVSGPQGPAGGGGAVSGGTSGSLEPHFLRENFPTDGPGPARLAVGLLRTQAQRNPVVSQTPLPAAPSVGNTSAPPGVTPISASTALNNFANSAGMQFQLQRGGEMINNNYAAHGQLQSGAAMRALQDYGQQTALNNYFMPYMGLLSGQQSVGAGAASSIAGVGANFGNTAANINAGMGANIQNGANAASNAALLRGQANANMWSGIGGALGGLASSFFPTGGGF